MSDDFDALLAQADLWRGHSPLADDLAAAVRTLRTERDEAVEVVLAGADGFPPSRNPDPPRFTGEIDPDWLVEWRREQRRMSEGRGPVA